MRKRLAADVVMLQPLLSLSWVGAGLTVTMDVAVLSRAKSDGPPFERAHFAAGCFWVRGAKGG
jgi:hypothetical protein